MVRICTAFIYTNVVDDHAFLDWPFKEQVGGLVGADGLAVQVEFPVTASLAVLGALPNPTGVGVGSILQLADETDAVGGRVLCYTEVVHRNFPFGESTWGVLALQVTFCDFAHALQSRTHTGLSLEQFSDLLRSVCF